MVIVSLGNASEHRSASFSNDTVRVSFFGSFGIFPIRVLTLRMSLLLLSQMYSSLVSPNNIRKILMTDSCIKSVSVPDTNSQKISANVFVNGM